MALPDFSLPMKSQFFLPMVSLRSPRSAVLLRSHRQTRRFLLLHNFTPLLIPFRMTNHSATPLCSITTRSRTCTPRTPRAIWGWLDAYSVSDFSSLLPHPLSRDSRTMPQRAAETWRSRRFNISTSPDSTVPSVSNPNPSRRPFPRKKYGKRRDFCNSQRHASTPSFRPAKSPFYTCLPRFYKRQTHAPGIQSS